jgi:hypothetical protein
MVGSKFQAHLRHVMSSALPCPIGCESTAACDETSTHIYVPARSVDIGAYSVPLGRRVIQKKNAATPILKFFLHQLAVEQQGCPNIFGTAG